MSGWSPDPYQQTRGRTYRGRSYTGAPGSALEGQPLDENGNPLFGYNTGSGGFGNGQRGPNGGMGYYQPQTFGMGGYNTQRGPNGTYNLAGDNLGSVNYGAVSGLGNFLDNTGSRGAAYLRSMGIMPTINGVAMDQASGGTFNYGGGQGGDFTGQINGNPWGGTYHGVVTQQMIDSGDVRARGFANTDQWGASGQAPAGSFHNVSAPGGGIMRVPNAPPGGSSGGSGFGGSGGSLGGLGGGALGSLGASAAGGLGTDLGSLVQQGYGNLIGNGGSPYTAGQRAQFGQQAADTISHGTQDALEQARMDAIRRGDTSGSSLPSLEATIRARGAADSQRARFGVETGLSSQAIQNLLQGLGGAGGYLGKQGELAVLAGQLAAQGGLGGLGMVMGL